MEFKTFCETSLTSTRAEAYVILVLLLWRSYYSQSERWEPSTGTDKQATRNNVDIQELVYASSDSTALAIAVVSVWATEKISICADHPKITSNSMIDLMTPDLYSIFTPYFLESIFEGVGVKFLVLNLGSAYSSTCSSIVIVYSGEFGIPTILPVSQVGPRSRGLPIQYCVSAYINRRRGANCKFALRCLHCVFSSTDQ